MYRLTPTENIIYKIDESMFIPKDEANLQYQAYLAWLKKGNKPEAWVPFVPAE
jgi:hypothetical protein